MAFSILRQTRVVAKRQLFAYSRCEAFGTGSGIATQIAPGGILRAAINMRNPLLVTGKTASGDPDGVAPDMAREVAKRLNLELKLLPYDSPGSLTDDADKGAWDIALVANEPARAKVIDFTSAYTEIEATYMVPPGSPLKSVEDVDARGIRVAAVARGAYQLWLTDNLKHAEVVLAEGHEATFEAFVEQKLDALSGLRDKLQKDSKNLPGAIVLDGKFTSVLQSIGVPKGNSAGHSYLQGVVDECLANGFVKGLVEKHGVVGKLAVAS